jgi:hypothetical protein
MCSMKSNIYINMHKTIKLPNLTILRINLFKWPIDSNLTIYVPHFIFVFFPHDLFSVFIVVL